MIQSTSQQKKKQCSSPLSTCGDKTSVCSTPSLSPIKNEPLIIIEKINRQETSTPVLLAMPSNGQHSPLLRSSSASSSIHSLSQKQKNQTSSNDTSLLSFERHELSAGNTTLSTTNEKSIENHSPSQIVLPRPSTTNADWSYYVTVGETNSKELEKPSSSSSSSSNSSNHDDVQAHHHTGGLEFFIDAKHQQDNSTRKHDDIFLFH